jgi:hypothetical protein
LSRDHAARGGSSNLGYRANHDKGACHNGRVDVAPEKIDARDDRRQKAVSNRTRTVDYLPLKNGGLRSAGIDIKGEVMGHGVSVIEVDNDV